MTEKTNDEVEVLLDELIEDFKAWKEKGVGMEDEILELSKKIKPEKEVTK